jgi:predicted small lipoprotein YifL
VTFRSTSIIGRLAIASALAATLALAACGRKGPLDAPPGALDPALNAAPTENPEPSTLLGNMTQSSSKPVAPKGPDKRIPLDVLLD